MEGKDAAWILQIGAVKYEILEENGYKSTKRTIIKENALTHARSPFKYASDINDHESRKTWIWWCESKDLQGCIILARPKRYANLCRENRFIGRNAEGFKFEAQTMVWEVSTPARFFSAIEEQSGNLSFSDHILFLWVVLGKGKNRPLRTPWWKEFSPADGTLTRTIGLIWLKLANDA